MGPRSFRSAGWTACGIVGILVVSALVVPSALAKSPTPGPVAPAVSLSALAGAPLSTVPDDEPGIGLAGAAVTGPIHVTAVPILVSFGFTNQTALSDLLAGLSNPPSPSYRHYLTASEFDRSFALPESQYEVAVEYFESFGISSVTTYADHAALTFSATPFQVDAAFHTHLATWSDAGRSFYAPTEPLALPAPLARMVGSVEGLSSYSAYLNHGFLAPHPTFAAPPSTPAAPSVAHPAYLTPPSVGGVQYEYASDFQVAYDQLSLFDQAGYPTNAVVATILWSGEYLGSTTTTPNGTIDSGQYVGSYDPTDISQFYNETIPAGEPHSVVSGVPILGAPAPGYFASFDSTQANIENTLDLEMVGSTAPGSHIYNVYGGNSTNVDLDAAFATVLNPNSSESGLDNVSVISNSWGGTDANDSNWFNYTEEAAARGISVLAATGDSGSNPSSNWGPGVFFPATMAYDDFGDVAVGGTTVTLSTFSLQMSSDIAWYESPTYTSPNPPAGTTGGISSVFAEPSWQSDTSANAAINGAGRGVPDIAALANNTLMTITIDGATYRATNATQGGSFFPVGGTSVACPLEAGIVADIDHVLGVNGNGWLGFFDPTVYPIASEMTTGLPSTVTTGFYPTGNYTSPLPTLPFYDVVSGANYLYTAAVGYDLATGWGSIDAYNLTMYVLSYQPNNVPGDLSGVRAVFNLTGLSVTSTLPGGGVNTYFNASLQENFFLANSLGAPIYWVQNVVYINATPGGWAMNFTGWVVYPFYGQYPTEAVYEYNFPVAGLVLSPSIAFNLTTTLVNTTGLNGQAVDFSFGVPGTSSLSLPVPGAAFIIGTQSYNYSWEGTNFSNGPYPAPYGGPGGLDPQFGLVGGPSGGIGNFGAATGGNLELYLERSGTSGFIPGFTQSYGYEEDQTGETASNLSWVEVSPTDRATDTPAVWNASYEDGAATQGVYEYDQAEAQVFYVATFQETGLAAGTLWGLSLSWSTGGLSGTCLESICQVYLTNDTYTWSAGSVYGYVAQPSGGQFTIAGANVTINLAYVPYTDVVTFVEAGLPTGQRWYVNVTGGIDLTSTTGTVSSSFSNGTYFFTVATALWSPHPPQGSFTVNGANVTVPISFTPPETFAVAFVESGLPSGTNWTVAIVGTTPVTTASGSVVFHLLNGTYSYTITTTLGGWTSDPASGTVDVNGSSTTLPVAFLQPTYAVTFNESGLPDGSLWSVILTGGPTLSSTNATEPAWGAINGTYSFTVVSRAPGYAPSPRNGTVTVTGSPVDVAITFVQVVYEVLFVASGLPNGSVWSVTLVGSALVVPSNDVVAADLPNGTYQFTVNSPPGYLPAAGALTVTVQGLNQTVPVAFHSTSTSSGTGTPFGIPTGSWLLIAVVVAVVVAVLAMLLVRRRPPARTAASAEPAETPGSP